MLHYTTNANTEVEKTILILLSITLILKLIVFVALYRYFYTSSLRFVKVLNF